MSSSASDALFGPQLPGHFDFTILFEHAMMWLVPTGLAILVTPFYLKSAMRAERKVRPGKLLWIQMACGLALVGLQATNIALWHNTDYFRSSVTVAACSMSLVASICTMCIIAITHMYSLQSSAFLSIFFTLTGLFDIAMARSYFLRDTLGAIASLQTCVVILKLVLIILQEVPKRSLYLSETLQSSVSAESASGFWNRSMFLWLNPLLIFGWRKRFKLDDLPNIGEEFASEKLFDRFSPHWAQADKTSRFVLLFALLRTLKWQFVQAFLPRLLHTGFVLAQPFLLLRTVEAVNQEHISSSTSNGLIGACALIYTGIAITKTVYGHLGYRVITSVRGILLVAIYDKTHKLSAETLESGAALTLMSTDVEGTEAIVDLAYSSWSCILQIVFGIWALYTFIGLACFLIIPPTLATFIGSLLTGDMISTARAAWNAETENRVAATSNMLAQLKSVKSMGLSGSLLKHIEKKREVEVTKSLKERYSLLWLYTFGAINFTVTPAIVFAGAYFWTRANDPMSVAEVFAILAVLAISSNPLIEFFQYVTEWSGAFASIKRIQSFLLLEERVDPRDHSVEEERNDTGEQGQPLTNWKPFAAELSEVSVSSPTTGAILHQVTLTIPWGSRAMIRGPINCGKSTLLKLLLGEVKLETGSVTVGSSEIAYCSQETWIENMTCEKGITGALGVIQPLYNQIVTACGLDVDFKKMSNGDQTQTGSGGCNLSGGQRQRLSLARAAYAQKKIMVLDDMFSSVDAETTRLVFHRLLGPEGIVRQWNCTIIMTTNQLELLKFADQVFQVSKTGKVRQQRQTSGNAASNILGNNTDIHEAEILDAEVVAVSTYQDTTHASEDAEADLPSVQPKEGSAIPEPAMDTSGGDLSTYKFFLGSAGVLVLSIWCTFAMFGAVGEWMPVIFLRIWFVEDPNNRHLFVGYGILSVASVFFNILNAAFYFTFVFPNTTKEMHRRLLKTVLGSTPEFINKTDSGSLLNRFSQDISLITRRLAMLVNEFIFLTFTTLVEVGMIAAGSWYAVPVIIFILLVLFIIQFFYLRSSTQLRELELEASSSLFTCFSETTDGIHHVRSFGWQKIFRQRLVTALDKSQKPTYLLYCIQRWLSLTMDLTSTVASLVLVTVSLKLPQSTSSAAVGLAMLSLIGFSSTATGYIRVWTSFETSLGAIRRVRSFVFDTPQEQDTVSETPVPDNWPTEGNISFSAVSATYTTTDGASNKALDNATFSVVAGQKIGIMGRTGSGKSTAISTILRMVEHEGDITIDGRNTRDVPRELLRSRITTISQEGLRLKATLRFNMYPFEGVQPTDDEIIDALRIVDLWTHAELHGGLDAQYSAIRFSTAQKQLMFLARGILHQSTANTSIVLIDEVTSSLTLDMERDMQRVIDHAFAGCTILLISHRRESFLTADLVLRFKSGKLSGRMRWKQSTSEWVEARNA